MKANDYTALIWAKLKGEISTEEEVQLSNWMEVSEENKAIAASVEQIWQKSGQYEKAFQVDMDEEFAHLMTRIKVIEKPVAKVVELPVAAKPLRLVYLRAAAIAIPLLLAGVWMFSKFAGATTASAQIVQAGQKSEVIVLADGSKVWLNKGAELRFPQQFPNNERRVSLSGEAFFEVTHLEKQPFLVELNDGTIVEDLGTEFGIRNLSNESTTTVVVKSGKVRFSDPKAKGGVVLIANQKGVYDRKTQRFVPQSIPSLNDIAWHSGTLSFINRPLSAVIVDLENYYNVSIILKNKDLAECSISLPVINGSVDNTMQTVADVLNMELKKENSNQYVLSGGKCK